MNTITHLPVLRLKRAKQNRFNPISNLSDPQVLTRKLDAFEAGYLKEAVNIWDSLEQRDDLIRGVVSKRKKAVGRQGWTVLIHESVPAERRAEADSVPSTPLWLTQRRRFKLVPIRELRVSPIFIELPNAHGERLG